MLFLLCKVWVKERLQVEENGCSFPWTGKKTCAVRTNVFLEATDLTLLRQWASNQHQPIPKHGLLFTWEENSSEGKHTQPLF